MRTPESNREVDYLIVGGGVAGGHAAFEIRKHDKRGRIVIVNRENQFPYDRPPLSKEYLAGEQKRGDVYFKADSYFARNKVEVIKQHYAQTIDTSDLSVTLDDGMTLHYKALLLTTGGRVRTLSIPGADLDGVHYLRTIDDCDAIKRAVKRSRAKKSKEAVIVGGGFIGCEVAATLRRKGMNVTLVHNSSRLLSSAVDEETANWLGEYHSRKGVRVLTNANATRFIGDSANGTVSGVELQGGESLSADFVVVGIGIMPNTELGEKAGLKVEEGIVVDEHLKTSAEHVFAAGDIARFYSPLHERYLRVEHVDVAQKHGAIAGSNMVSEVRKRRASMKSFDEPPYFFSYQFDLEFNAYGDLSKRTSVVRRGELEAKTGFIQFYFDDHLLNGILSVNADWKDIERARKLVEMRKEFTDPSILSDKSRTLVSVASRRKTA